MQALLAPGLCVLFLGLRLAPRAGRLVLVGMTCLWAYLLAATWFARLIPFYAGYPAGPVRLADLLRWYTASFASGRELLATTAMVAPGALMGLALASVAAAAVLGVLVCKRALLADDPAWASGASLS